MIYKYLYRSPICNLYLYSDGEYLRALLFSDSIDCIEGKKEIFIETIEWLDTYFKGEIPAFLPKYKLMDISSFTGEVLEYIKDIPYGQTITYGEIAEKIALKRGIKKMSAQAVGRAAGANPLAIIIPCHRVIGQKASLVGYGGGLENKNRLLKLEEAVIKKALT